MPLLLFDPGDGDSQLPSNEEGSGDSRFKTTSLFGSDINSSEST
ncbi:hypothetical protein A2U01_0119116, partial [Trifolium medium]|nr:hypothetical protein [Trifolium medium]